MPLPTGRQAYRHSVTIFGFEIFNRDPLIIYLPLGRGFVAVAVTLGHFDRLRVFVAVKKNHSEKGGLMDPKLVRQFIIFLIILFGWTIVVLLVGCK